MALLTMLGEMAPLGELAGLGTSGVMGAMWLWERRSSRERERQLDEAHARVMGDRTQLDQLVKLVRQNTEAFARLAAVQERLLRRMDQKTKYT